MAKFVLQEDLKDDAKAYFGTTWDWKRAFYINTDGTLLDGSGERFGARGRARTIDHREIADIMPDKDSTEAMLVYMNEGNIRWMPETPGFELIIEPTEAQYRTIDKLLYYLKDLFYVDFSAPDGRVILSKTYARGSRQVIFDMEDFFANKRINIIEALNNAPEYLYHATYKPFLNSILSKGLGNTRRKMWSDSKGKGIVYLAQTPEAAYSYAEEAEWLDNVEDYDKYADNIIVLKIATDRLNTNNLIIDENVRDDSLQDKDRTIEYHGVIDKSAIIDIVNEEGKSMNILTEVLNESMSAIERKILKEFSTNKIEESPQSIFIFPDGKIATADYHADMLDLLYDEDLIDDDDYNYYGSEFVVEETDAVRASCLEAGENYIAIPAKMTAAQYDVLTDFLDMDQQLYSEIQITTAGYRNRGNVNSSKIYSFKEYTTDDIIKKIKRYYSSGTLYEDYKSDLQSIFKDSYQVTKLPPKYSSYLMPDGNFINLGNIPHGIFRYAARDNNFNLDLLDEAIELNTGKNPKDPVPAYIGLFKKPTEEQYNSLLLWLDKLSGNIEINVPKTSKTYNLKDYTSDDIVKKIKRYFASGNLYEDKVEKANNIYYHGSPKCDIVNFIVDKNDRPQTFFTKSRAYALEYAHDIDTGAPGCLYTVRLDIKNPLDTKSKLGELLKHKLNCASNIEATDKIFNYLQKRNGQVKLKLKDGSTKTLTFDGIKSYEDLTKAHLSVFGEAGNACYVPLNSDQIKIIKTEKLKEQLTEDTCTQLVSKHLHESVKRIEAIGYASSLPITVLTTYSAFDVANYLLNTTNKSVCIVYDDIYEQIYAFGDGYTVMHPDLWGVIDAYYALDRPNIEDEDYTEDFGIDLLYIPKGSVDHEVNSLRIDDYSFAANFLAKYTYSFGTMLVSDKLKYDKTSLAKILAKNSKEPVIIEESVDTMISMPLLEDTRTQLVTKSRNAGQYRDTSRGKNRFERKKYSKVASQVKSYNQIDMNQFFKQDTLEVKIPVAGENDEYTVTIKMEGVCSEIAKNIKSNNNRLEFRTIVQAVTKIFNTANVYVNCTCKDFKFRFDHWSVVNNYGTTDSAHDPGPGRGIANPKNDKGIGCKHILLTLANADWVMKVASVINNYINYAQEHMQKAFLKIIFPKLYGIPATAAEEEGLVPEDTNLDTEKHIIDLINDYGKNRGKYQKGSNKNPVTNTGGRQKITEPAEEAKTNK